MQASDEVGPKILFDFSQVEARYPVLNLQFDLQDQGWTLHPDTLLPKSDSGKITIQGWTSRAANVHQTCIGGKGEYRFPPYVVEAARSIAMTLNA